MGGTLAHLRAMAPLHCDGDFQLEPLLERSTSIEGDGLEDRELSDSEWRVVQPVPELRLSQATGPARTQFAQPRPSSPLQKQSRHHIKRRRCRDNAILSMGHTPGVRAREHAARSVPVQTRLDTEGLPADSSGYQARNGLKPEEAERSWQLDSLVASGLRLVEWDGR